MQIFSNGDLSIKSVGVYCMIKCLNDNGERVSQPILASMTCTGQKTIETAIKELKEKGYLEIEKKNVNGTFMYNYKLLK